MYMCICVYVYMCICVYVYMCICVYVYMCICVYVYMCICVYVYMYMYMPAGGRPRQRFARFCKHARSVRYVMGLGLGWGGGEMLFAPMEEAPPALFGLFQRPQGKDDKGKFLFCDIKVAGAKRGGKPPLESAARILASQALNFVKQSPTTKSNVDHRWNAVLSIFECRIYPNLVGAMKLATTLKGSFVSKTTWKLDGSNSHRWSGCNVATIQIGHTM